MLNQNLNEGTDDEIQTSTTKVSESVMQVQTIDDSLEDYLDKITAPIIGSIPRSKRIEIRESVRRHVEQLAAAQRARGCGESEAFHSAISQCTAPEIVTLVLPQLQIAMQGQTSNSRSVRKLLDRITGSANWSTVIALLTFGLPYIIYLAQSSARLRMSIEEPDSYSCRIWLFAAPLIAGALAGLVSREKAIRGVVNTVALITIQAFVIGGIEVALKISKIGPDFETFAGYNLVSVFTGLVPWLLLGSLSAAVASFIRRAGSRYARAIRHRFGAHKNQVSVRQTGM